jgi:hypothetical protein
VFPTKAPPTGAGSSLATVFLVGGAITAVLSTFAVFLAQSARLQAAALDRSRQ